MNFFVGNFDFVCQCELMTFHANVTSQFYDLFKSTFGYLVDVLIRGNPDYAKYHWIVAMN